MSSSITRREWLGCSAAVAMEVLVASRCHAQPVEARLETHTYKTIDSLQIKADVYRYPDERIRPVVVWIHGGALIGGHRGEVPGRIKKHAMDAGYVLISLDYRLAPETLLPQIIEDIEDAFRWIRRVGARQFNIDSKRVAVIGGSAGGYLTLTSGFRVDPPPTVIFSLWGYGDLIGDWYSKPSPHRASSSKQVVARGSVSSGERTADFRRARSQGRRRRVLSVLPADRHVADRGFRLGSDESTPTLSPVHAGEERDGRLSADGVDSWDADTDVPFEQSVLMAEQLKRHKVHHLMIGIQDGEHGLSGENPKQIDAAYAKAFAFVDERLMCG